jgi:hypothetical protein
MPATPRAAVPGSTMAKIRGTFGYFCFAVLADIAIEYIYTTMRSK